MRFFKQKWVLVALAIVATALTIYYVVPKFTKKVQAPAPAPAPAPPEVQAPVLSKLAASAVTYSN